MQNIKRNNLILLGIMAAIGAALFAVVMVYFRIPSYENLTLHVLNPDTLASESRNKTPFASNEFPVRVGATDFFQIQELVAHGDRYRYYKLADDLEQFVPVDESALPD